MPMADKVVIASIDGDGCYLSKLASSGRTYRPSAEQLRLSLEHNKLLIEDLLQVAKDKKLILECSSSRQDLRTDYLNALKENVGPGSFYPYLEYLEGHLKSLGMNVVLNKFLMADKDQRRKFGTTWKLFND